MVISELNENDVPEDVREASTKAIECQIYDQWDRFGATQKEWAIATARNIEDCHQMEEAFKNITDLYLIRRAIRKEEGVIDDEAWELVLLEWQDKCRRTRQKLKEVEVQLKKLRKKLDLKPGSGKCRTLIMTQRTLERWAKLSR
jgi:hypothetical protein